MSNIYNEELLNMVHNTIEENIIEKDNIVPNLRRRFFDASERNYISELRSHADNICRMKIPPQYIRAVFNRFKRGICYYDNNNQIIGFAIWKLSSLMSKSDPYTINKSMYIYLICAKKNDDYMFGNIIFPDLDAYCNDNNVKVIELERADDGLQVYYEKYGFISSPIFPGSKLMTKSFNIPTVERKPYNRTRRRSRFVKTISK